MRPKSIHTVWLALLFPSLNSIWTLYAQGFEKYIQLNQAVIQDIERERDQPIAELGYGDLRQRWSLTHRAGECVTPRSTMCILVRAQLTLTHPPFCLTQLQPASWLVCFSQASQALVQLLLWYVSVKRDCKGTYEDEDKYSGVKHILAPLCSFGGSLGPQGTWCTLWLDLIPGLCVYVLPRTSD